MVVVLVLTAVPLDELPTQPAITRTAAHMGK
jgi:hypothetical protein